MMGHDILDLIILLTLAFFAVRGGINGFVGEVAGILGLIGGFWAANAWHYQAASLVNFIADPAWRSIVAYLLIFMAVLLAVGLFARLLRKLISLSFIGWVDKLAGMLLGLGKGVLLCSIVFLLLQTVFRNAPFLENSRTRPHFAILTEHMRSWLPHDILERPRVHKPPTARTPTD